MKPIKFSHESYSKLSEIAVYEPLCLLEVLNVDLKDLHQPFVDYDTSYYNEKGKLCHYPLPQKGAYLLLVFEDCMGRIVTTLRRQSPRKAQYYRESIGEDFQVVFTEGT